MEITGTIYTVLPETAGTSRQGNPYRIGHYVLKYQLNGNDLFFAFDVFDGSDHRIERLNIQEGKCMTIYFNVMAHEYNGNWYNKVQAYDAREVQQ